MKVGKVVFIEYVAFRGVLKCFFVMKDSILKSFNLLVEVVVVEGSLCLMFRNGAEETIHDGTQQDSVDVGIVL